MREIENLDTVLTYIYEDGTAHISKGELQDGLKKVGIDFSDRTFIGGDNSLSRLEIILNKLKKDGYIDKWQTTFSQNSALVIQWRLAITYDGIIYQKSGGYKAELERKNAEKDFPKKLNNLTFWLVIGSFLLAGIEIIRFLHELYPCFP